MEEDISQFFGEEFSPGNQTFKKPLRPVNDGEIVVGVMSQMGALKNDPEGWKRFFRLHWGFKVRSKNDPTKTYLVKFHCLRKFGKGGMIVRDCPMCMKIDAKREEADAYESELILKKKGKEETKTLMAPLRGWLKTYNVDGKWYMFAMTPDGEFNKFLLSHKTMGDLRAEMNKYEAKFKKNPRSHKGLAFWRVIRNGNSKSVGKMLEKVEPVTDSVTVTGQDGVPIEYQKVRAVVLTDDQIRKAMKEYTSLEDVDAYTLTEAQIQELADCDEDPETVERIIGISAAPAVASPPATSASAAPVTPPKAAEQPAAPAPASAPVEDDEEAQLMKALAAARLRKAELAKSASTAAPVQVEKKAAPAAPPPSAATGFANMTDEEMWKHFNLTPADVGLPSKDA